MTLTMPNTPILVMMPDKGADTEEGAAGWASGQPGMQGHKARLGCETGQAENQSGLQPERKLRGGLGRCGKDAEQKQARAT